MNDPILPSSTIGVFGAGQLGRMLAMAARRMGYRVAVYSPETDAPAAQWADVHVRASYADLDAVERFAGSVAAVTVETENVPMAALERAARFAPVRPSPEAVLLTQNRLREKEMLARLGMPTVRWKPVRSRDDLDAALQGVGLPGILKTADSGYDGKGQLSLSSAHEAATAWDRLGGVDLAYEQRVELASELSVIVVRSVDGRTEHYEPFGNLHVNHILDTTIFPALVPEKIRRDAIDIARGIAVEMKYIGVLCVEFFLTQDGALLVNELAPRPHNSGHVTIEAHVTSQFEQQVRATCGLPPGSTRVLRPAAMANLLGDLWEAGAPHWEKLAEHGDVKLHLYGKSAPRAGRKMGHLTATGAWPEEALCKVVRARLDLKRPAANGAARIHELHDQSSAAVGSRGDTRDPGDCRGISESSPALFRRKGLGVPDASGAQGLLAGEAAVPAAAHCDYLGFS